MSKLDDLYMISMRRWDSYNLLDRKTGGQISHLLLLLKLSVYKDLTDGSLFFSPLLPIYHMAEPCGSLCIPWRPFLKMAGIIPGVDYP